MRELFRETQGLVPVSKIEANTDCTDLHGYEQKPEKPSLQYVSDLAVLYDARHLFFLKNKIDYIEPAFARHNENKFSSALA